MMDFQPGRLAAHCAAHKKVRKPVHQPLLVAKGEFARCSQLQQGIPVPSPFSQPCFDGTPSVAPTPGDNVCFDVPRDYIVPPFMHMEDYYIRECLAMPTHAAVGFSPAPPGLRIPCVIPSPPVMPIINPVVYSNNQDIGTSDLQYIPENLFAVINLHPQPAIMIPRMTEPSATQGIVPSLIPCQEAQVRMAKASTMEEREIESESPPSLTSTQPVSAPSNKDKLIVLGFSWYSEPKEIRCDDDVWLK